MEVRVELHLEATAYYPHGSEGAKLSVRSGKKQERQRTEKAWRMLFANLMLRINLQKRLRDAMKLAR